VRRRRRTAAEGDCVWDAASDGTLIVAVCATPRIPERAAASDDASCFEARNLARWL
jgi:hypothetical protein